MLAYRFSAPPPLSGAASTPRHVLNAEERSTLGLRCARAAAAPSVGSLVVEPPRAPSQILDPSAMEVFEWLRQEATGTRNDTTVMLDRVERAAAALAEADPSLPPLSLERDILPKAEILRSLHPTLAYKVFIRYPEEFAHPDAAEYWTIMAAYLIVLGFTEPQLSTLFSRRPLLFARSVQDPANLKAVFDWLKDEGISQRDVARMIHRYPLLVQSSVEDTLKPRLAYYQALGLTRVVAANMIKRQPELLGVEQAYLQQRVEFLKECGLSEWEIARLFSYQPAVFGLRVEGNLAVVVAYLRDELGCEGHLLRRLISSSGLLTRSLDTIKNRVEKVKLLLGDLSPAELRRVLMKFNRILTYPLEEPKYQKKIAFLVEFMGMEVHDLTYFPQFLSYRLEERIAPRTVAYMAAHNGKPPCLSSIAKTHKGFLKYAGLTDEQYTAAVDAWAKSDEGRRWLGEPESDTEAEKESSSDEAA